MSNSHIRQQDIVTPEELSVPITLIGAGGIGSWVALALTKMGCSQLTVVDHDAVEEHNVASQFYSTEDLSQEKVYCLSENLEKFTGQVVRPVFQRFEDYINSEEYSVPEILLVTVDSLNASRS
jgi:tRNA A37 threonylcarbamoyladenosine dehydratase